MDHAPFIWSAYGLSAIVLAWTALAPLFRARRVRARLQDLERARETQAQSRNRP